MEELQIGEVLRQAPEQSETVFEFLNAAGEEVRKVAIERRQLQPELPRVLPTQPIDRHPAREHVFHDVQAFCDYLNREAEAESSLVLADIEKRTIHAMLDESQESDRESVSLSAIVHPLFAPWEALLDRAIGVMDFALFAMKHRRSVVKPDGRDLALTFSQVKMSKTVSVSQGVGRKALNGVICEVSIAGERQDQIVELPETISIQCPIFLGTEPQEIKIDLLVTESGDKAVVYLTAADVESQRIEAFEEMVATIKEETGLLIGLGSIRHRAWKLVPLEDH